MKHVVSSSIIAALAGMSALLLSFPASAQAPTQTTLVTESLVTKVQQEQRMNLPTRGMTMAQVKAKYGEPLKVLPTRGGSSKFQPPINRWEYGAYIVFFERNHVIHSVLRTSGPHSM